MPTTVVAVASLPAPTVATSGGAQASGVASALLASGGERSGTSTPALVAPPGVTMGAASVPTSLVNSTASGIGLTSSSGR